MKHPFAALSPQLLFVAILHATAAETYRRSYNKTDERSNNYILYHKPNLFRNGLPTGEDANLHQAWHRGGFLSSLLFYLVFKRAELLLTSRCPTAGLHAAHLSG